MFGNLGIPGHEDDVVDLGPRLEERTIPEMDRLAAKLTKRVATENHDETKQDLEWCLRAIKRDREGEVLGLTRVLPMPNFGSTVFSGLRALLRAPGSEAHALARLRKYAGIEPGFTSIVKLAEARIEERIAIANILFHQKTRSRPSFPNSQSI